MYDYVMFCSLLLCSVSRGNTVEVLTKQGLVSGKIFHTPVENVEYYGFMGIPYAAPPVNELRFMVIIIRKLQLYLYHYYKHY